MTKTEDSMNNKHTNKSILNRYFSDFYKWNAILAALFIVSYPLGLIWGDSWSKYWGIPACFLVIVLVSIKYYILFFVSVKDLRGNRVKDASVIVQEVVQDKEFNLFNKSGIIMGHEKCLLVDSDGHKYRVAISRNVAVEPCLPKYNSGTPIDIRYLSKSRIVLHINMASADEAADHLRQDLHEYLT